MRMRREKKKLIVPTVDVSAEMPARLIACSPAVEGRLAQQWRGHRIPKHARDKMMMPVITFIRSIKRVYIFTSDDRFDRRAGVKGISLQSISTWG